MRSLPPAALLAVVALTLGSAPARAGDVENPPEGLSSRDWSSIRAAYEAHRYGAVAVEEGWQAHNPAQRWVTRFDGRGFSMSPDRGDWTWGLELRRFGFAGAENAVRDCARVDSQGQRVVYEWSSSLEEWWVNDTRGLEHGYTLKERPAGAEGPLTFTLALRGDLRARVASDGRGVHVVQADGSSVLTYGGLTVFDDAGRSLPAHMELGDADTLRLCIDERGARYPLTIDPIVQQTYLKASGSGTNAGDTFGRAVAIFGDSVVVGAPQEDSGSSGVFAYHGDNSVPDAGAAYVFERTGTTWTMLDYLKAFNVGSADLFGWSVSISADWVIVGAIGEDSNAVGVGQTGWNENSVDSGAAYAFRRHGPYTDVPILIKASNTSPGAAFGTSVSLDQNTLVVGATLEDGTAVDSGAAYVFVFNGTVWSQQALLKASNPGAQDSFGVSVCVSNDTIVVGANKEDSSATGINGNQLDNGAADSGAAYVFTRTGTVWTQQAYLKPSNTEMLDGFGGSVALSADTIVVGAEGEDSSSSGIDGPQGNGAADSGAAYVFARSGTAWTQQAYLKASNTGALDQFGQRVGVSGDTVVVGARKEGSNSTGVNGPQGNESAPAAGAAYVFVRNGTTWSQEAYLKASNADAGDEFAMSVCVSADTVLCGAWLERSNSVCVNGNESDNSASASGAAYVFVRNGTTWAQQAYLKSADPSTVQYDRFGTSVSLSGDTAVVGAYGEDSASLGVNGNQADDSLDQAGAAYVFVRNGTTWTQQAYLKASNTGWFDSFGLSVSVSGDTIVVGARSERSNATGVNGNQSNDLANGSGAAYVFVRNGTSWSQQAYLKASNTAIGDQFGSGVAVSGDTIVVGAWEEDSSATGVNGNQADNGAPGSGAAYVFVRNGTTWSQEAYLKPSNTVAGGVRYFGATVAIDADTIVVGSYQEDSDGTGVNGNQANTNADQSGAAYVFRRSGMSWSQEAYLKASNAGIGDWFGLGVAVSGDTVVVGAALEDSATTGVNGDPYNEGATNSGAAYVYVRNGTSWSQEAYLKASNTATEDRFGSQVSVSGDVVAVGAFREDGTGPNGSDRGAVYVFVRSGTTWSEAAYLGAANWGDSDRYGESVSVSGSDVLIGAGGEDSSATFANPMPFDDRASEAGAAYVAHLDLSTTLFCFGDGTPVACPCGNNGTLGRGCGNSAFSGGAQLTASGSASIGTDTLVLTASDMAGPGMFFQGTDTYANGLGLPFGDGVLCTGGAIVRLGVVFPSGNSASYPGGFTPSPIHVAGATANGDTRHYQVWYRDAASFCSPSTFNLTSGLTILWGP